MSKLANPNKRAIETYEQRFLAKVEKTDGCWLWRGAHCPKGYGHILVDGRYEKAHRLAVRIYRGPIPTGMFVCHTCDTPACVNPAHLWIGTPQQNSDDCRRKGRLRTGITVGEANHFSKLTSDEVETIRATPKAYGVATRLARFYGVRANTISDIWAGRSWGRSA